MPDSADHLIVDFYSVKNEKWFKIWEIKGGIQQHSFTQVILPVPDTFVMNGFRFRFRNLTSLSSTNTDKQSNASQWHIDYVQLKPAKNRTVMKNLNDVAIVEPLLPSLTDYTTVPWKHYTLAQGSLSRSNIPLKFRTYFPEMPSDSNIIVTRTYISRDLVNDLTLNVVGGSEGYENEVPPNDFSYYGDPFSTDFGDSVVTDTLGILELTAYIDPKINNQNRVNDTVRRIETYYSDYAYDDGSAEFGFGISGESQGLIQIANRYRIYRKSNDPDSLKAVKIYFNKTLNNSTRDIEFKVCVWKNSGNMPGALIYESSETYFPDTTKVFAFSHYELDTPILVYDTIFVGIEQTESRFINIGYDINFNSLQNIYVKTSFADWYNPYSLEPGSLMIRPCFSSYNYPVSIKNTSSSEFNVYPVPANDILYFNDPKETYPGSYLVKVINTLGITVIETNTHSGSLDVSNLKKGIYILVLTSTDNKTCRAVKFLKN